MKIQVITLPTARGRQQKIKQSFDAQQLNYEFKDGVNINDCEFVQINDDYYVKYGDCVILINEQKTIQNISRNWIRFGEIAAYIAHYNLWKKFLNSNEDRIIICEDDAYPQSDMTFLDSFDYTDIQFINLQTVTAHNQEKQFLYRDPFVKVVNKDLVLYKTGLPILCEGLAAYLLTKQGAKILCDYIEKNGFVGPNDSLITKMGQSGELLIHSPVELHKCFSLDSETYEYSYTHSGSFKTYKKFNDLVLQIKE